MYYSICVISLYFNFNFTGRINHYLKGSNVCSWTQHDALCLGSSLEFEYYLFQLCLSVSATVPVLFCRTARGGDGISEVKLELELSLSSSRLPSR